jgi:hypothetical protein
MLDNAPTHEVVRHGAADDHRLLALLPLVAVAWASGRMHWLQRNRILTLASGRFRLGAEGHARLRHWLARPPPVRLIEHGLGRLSWMAMSPHFPEIEVGDLQELLLIAEWIARAGSGVVDAPSAVGHAEERVLREIASLLGVESGLCWSALLRELD